LDQVGIARGIAAEDPAGVAVFNGFRHSASSSVITPTANQSAHMQT
jgi:hypothetical protein